MMGEDFTEQEMVKLQADFKRAEAKRLLNRFFFATDPESTESEALNNAVDCIIAAAVLEMKASQ